MTIFVDTSGFYAFLDPADRNHADAVTLFTRATQEDWTLVTTSYVVQECWSLLQSRHGWDALDAWVPDILSHCTIIWVNASMHALGAERCRHARERGFSLTDGVSLAYMRQAGIRHAIAFDRHFDREGIRDDGDGPETIGTGLNPFIGSWSATEEQEILDSIADLSQVDENLWK